MKKKQPLVILLSGLPGTGKSTLARRLSKKYRLERISTDSVRKRVFPTVRKNSFGAGSYSFENRVVVYNIIYYLLYTLLRWNIGCVIDGTFYKESFRIKIKRIAEKFDAKFVLVFVECPESLIKQRFEQREKRSGRTLSDANYEIYLKLKERFQPTRLPHIKVNIVYDKNSIMEKIENVIRKGYSQ